MFGYFLKDPYRKAHLLFKHVKLNWCRYPPLYRSICFSGLISCRSSEGFLLDPSNLMTLLKNNPSLTQLNLVLLDDEAAHKLVSFLANNDVNPQSLAFSSTSTSKAADQTSLNNNDLPSLLPCCNHRCFRLKSLCVKGNEQYQLTHQGIVSLCKIQSLTELRLCDHHIGNCGAKNIALYLPNLKILTFSHCNLSDEGAMFMFFNLRKLRTLEICWSQITVCSLIHLSKASNENRFSSLSSLNLSNNPQLNTLDCMKILAHGIKTLRNLHLCSCSINDPCVNELATSQYLQKLDLSDNQQITDSSLSSFCNNSTLTSLSLSNCRNISNAGLINFLHHPSLRKLDLSTTEIDNNGVLILCNTSTLISVDLSKTNINDESIVILATMNKSLRELSLHSTQIGDKACNSLIENNRIESLVLCNTNITDHGLRNLPSANNLKKLKLRWNNGITDFSVNNYILGKSTSLTDLDLSYCRNLSASAKCKLCLCSTIGDLHIHSFIM